MRRERAEEIAIGLGAYRSLCRANGYNALAAVAYDDTGESVWELWEAAGQALGLGQGWLDEPDPWLRDGLQDALCVWQAELRQTIPAEDDPYHDQKVRAGEA